MKKLFTSSLISTALLWPAISSAEESPSTDSLNTVVITGGRTGVGIVNRPSTYVFSQTDIAESPANDLIELLADVPGFSIDHNGGRGATSNLRIRGSESDHVLVLIDGVRSASATSGTTSLQNIPLSQIDRIEVIKGPASGIHGADALGGVVQVFTKKGKNSTGGYIDLGAGSHDSSSVAAGFNGGDTIYYGANVNFSETDGISRQVTTTAPNSDNDAYREKGASFNFGRDVISGLDFDITHSVNQGNTEFDSGTTDDSTNFKLESTSLTSQYDVSSDLKLNLKAGNFKDDQQTFGANPSRFITRRNTVAFFANYDLSSQQSVVLGYDYYDDKVASTQLFTQTERATKARFLEYALNTDYFNAQLTYRNDEVDSVGSKDTGNLYLGLPIGKNHEISFSYGEAFKVPTFNDLFFPFTDFGFGFTFQGNPNLLPETSVTRQIGYAGQLGSVSIDFAAYRTKIKNLIQGTSTFDTVENIGEAKLRGAEFSISQKLKTIDYGVAISYVDAVNNLSQERLTRRPRSTFSGFINKHFNDDLSVSAKLRGESDRNQSSTLTTAGFGLLDLGLDYNVGKSSRLSVDVRNVFDKEYILVGSTTSTFNTEGRTFDFSYKYLF